MSVLRPCHQDSPSLTASVACTGELLKVENAQPTKDGFNFKKLENSLDVVGVYRLDYELQPAVPGREPLMISTQIRVSAGPASCMKITVRIPCPPSFSLHQHP